MHRDFRQWGDWARSIIERCVDALKQWRCVATRYEKRAANYRAVVVVAALLRWLVDELYIDTVDFMQDTA